MSMMARHTSSDVSVIGLIGERGREAKEFVEDVLGAEGWKNRYWSWPLLTKAR